MAITTLPSAVTTVRIGHRGPALVSVFHGWPNGDSLKAVVDAQAEVSKRFGRVVSITIIPAVDSAQLRANPAANQQLKPPEAEHATSIKESARVGEALSDTTIGSALVILPRGVMAVMIRSFVGAVSLVSRSKAPLQTFKDLAPAVEWLESLSGAPKMPGLVQDIEAWMKG